MGRTLFHERFPLDGRPRAVEVNRVDDDGRRWVNVMSARSFGLASSAWTGRRRRKQGLRRQAEKLLRAARQNLAYGEPPVVVFDFVDVVSDEVADALRSMGAEVRGTELTFTTDRIREGSIEAPFKHAFEAPDVALSRHAMWWADPTAAPNAYVHSDTRNAITRTYRAMSGVESETFTLLLRSLGMIGLRAPRVELPDNESRPS
jgi:hypothetical protein